MTPNKPDADKAAEENTDMTVEEFYSGFDLSWMTEEERQTIYTATELYAKGKLRQSGKERAALENESAEEMLNGIPLITVDGKDWLEYNDIVKLLNSTPVVYLKKYGQHLPTCNINQNWTEAMLAMADIPYEYRDDGYYEALAEIEVKRNKCTCGFEQALSTDVGEQDDARQIVNKIDDFLKKNNQNTR